MDLMVINTELQADEKKEIENEIDQVIEKYKNNRFEVNRLVFESVTALIASENYSHELNSQGTLKRLWGGFTGRNRELQSKIDSSLAHAQYASQRTLQKLAEQNLMSFELITAVNNKLNASMIEIDTEINKIYGTLITFFKQTKSEIIQLENRVERLERNVNLLNWQNSIEYQMWNGIEYADLDITSKIVCMVRDFYDITKGQWTVSDLLLLKSAMAMVDINPREVINCGTFIKELYMRKPLRDKLFKGKLTSDYLQSEYVAITSAVNKGMKLQEEENYIVQGVARCLEANNIDSSEAIIVDNLVQEYAKKELFFNPQMNVMVYDLIVELLYNIGQISYVPDEDIEKRLKVAERMYKEYDKRQEAIDEFLSLAEMGCARAMYFVGECYNWGREEVVEDKGRALEWWKKGMELGDPFCKVMYSIWVDIDDYDEKEKIRQETYEPLKKLSEDGDILAQDIFVSYVCEDIRENIYWLEKLNPEKDSWLSAKLRDCYYELGLELYGKDKTEEEYFEAIQYFMKAAELGSAHAMGYIGLMYDWGYGFKKNTPEANKWYKKGAENGSAFSMRNLADHLYQGYGVKEDKNLAKQWLLKAAELDFEDAKVQLKEKFGIEV